MKHSYLIQRLTKPWKDNPENPLHKLANAFAFGGGLMNGGLSKEAMDLFKDVFRFDYMGSSEFEWGAVPEAFNMIAKSIKDYIPYRIAVEYHKEKYSWNSNDKTLCRKDVYIICKKEWKEEVNKRIKAYAMGKDYDKMGTKEGVQLSYSLADEKDRVKGWIELDNGYMFFVDNEMFLKTCNLFGLEYNTEL